MEPETTAREFKQQRQDYWSTEDYGKWFVNAKGRHIDAIERQALRRILEKSDGLLLVDVGVGNGRLLSEYGPGSAGVVALDLSHKLLVEARGEASGLALSCFPVQADAERLPFERNRFDAVISTRTLQHTADWTGCLRQICSLAKADSPIYLMVYNRLSIYGVMRGLLEALCRVRELLRPRSQRTGFGHFNTLWDLRRVLCGELKLDIERVSGSGLFAVEIFPGRLPGPAWSLLTALARVFERLADVAPFKYLCGRLVLRVRVPPGGP